MPCFNASLVLAGRVAFVAAMTDITAPSTRPTSSWSVATFWRWPMADIPRPSPTPTLASWFRGTKVYAGGTR
jgi:hypothetical protein